jgi:hypothetical protein
MEKKWWTSSCGRIELWMFLHQAQSVSHPGECDMDVRFLSNTSNIKAQIAEIDSDVLKDVLSQYGCWDDEQLKDTKIYSVFYGLLVAILQIMKVKNNRHKNQQRNLVQVESYIE